MIKKFLVIILILCIIFMVGSIVFAGGTGSGDLDKFGGHFIKSNGLAVAYHYYSGPNTGYEITFTNPIKWEDRCKIKKPLDINDNTLGTWTNKCQTTAATTAPTEKPSDSISPSEETTPEPSATSEVSNSPENTPGQETAQTSVNPTSTNTGSTLPKTGQGPNIMIYFGITIVLAGLIISIIFRKKLFN
jgi:LPXTG-motif cell wall-anchored protein